MRRWQLLFVLVAIAAPCRSTRAQAPATSPNDILFDCPDPAIIRPSERSAVYVLSTGRGVPIYRSDDLLHWRQVDRVFPDGVPAWAKTTIPGARSIWAPDVRWFNGRYHVYYAVSTFGSQHSAIGLATNKSLDAADKDYRWEDRGLVLESAPGKSDFNAIDPALIVDHGNRPYLFWGSYWTGIKAAPLDPQTGKLPLGAKITPVAARAANVNPSAIEAPYVFEHGGYWYLFVSWDNCCDGERSTYKVMVGRSKSILGPYVDWHEKSMAEGGGTLVLGSYDKWRGPGHNSALSTSGGDWMVNAGFHKDFVRRGRVLQIRRMYWPEDGWPVVGEPIQETLRSLATTAPKPAVAGRWKQWIDYANESTVEFSENGQISSDHLSGTWVLRDGRLEVAWKHDPGEPLTRNKIRLFVTPDYYVGRDDDGRIVFGLKERL